MRDHDYDPAERADLSELDVVVADLLGRYIARREAGESLRTRDLLANAAEFGDAAVVQLRTALAFYEFMRAQASD